MGAEIHQSAARIRVDCVFVDLDGTIINSRSLLGLLRVLRNRLNPERPPWFVHYCEELSEMIANSVSRERLNRFYYTAYRGLLVDDVRRMGEEWFRAASLSRDFFNDETVRSVRKYSQEGARIVLVTGSFAPGAEPVARSLGCDAALCTNLEQDGGRYTGNVDGDPCIGLEKAKRVVAFAAERDLALETCVAFGDDDSDAAMLGAVGVAHWVTPTARYRTELARGLDALLDGP